MTFEAGALLLIGALLVRALELVATTGIVEVCLGMTTVEVTTVCVT